MPRRRNETQTGLVVTVVVLSVLVLILGVTTYLGFAGQADLKKNLEKANGDLKSMTIAHDWEKGKALMFKAYAGYASKEDLDALAGFDQTKYGDQPDKAAADAVFTKLADKNVLGWDAAKKAPTMTYREQVERLTKELKDERDGRANDGASANALIADLTSKLTAEQKKSASLANQLAQSRNEVEQVKATQSAEFKNLQKTVEDRDSEIVALKRDNKKSHDEYEGKLTSQVKENDDLKKNNEKLRQQATVRDWLALDEPKGKIVDINPDQVFAHINLGSADNVRPQLTFSVFGIGADGKAEKQRKAALEVVSVEQAHLSLAKIMQVRDQNRQPIMRGDLLFNPAWSPTAKQHIAIAGLIDLTGDGTDRTQEFIRTLERQNVVVDAYLDLKDLTVRGPGMNRNTDYLVVGAQPEADAGMALAEGNTVMERQKNIFERMGEMQTEAARLGVTAVPFKRFVQLIGFKLPRSYAPPDYNQRQPGVGTAIDLQEGRPVRQKASPKDKASEEPPDEGADSGEKPAEKVKKPTAKAKGAKKKKDDGDEGK